jgi:hypothetical protein
MRLLWYIVIPLLLASSWIALWSLLAIQRLVRRLKGRSLPGNPRSQELRTMAYLGAFLILTVISWFAGTQVRLWRCQSICNRTQPLLEALQKYRAIHGSFPSKLQDLSEVGFLAENEKIIIRQGKLQPAGIEVTGIGDVDVAVYLEPDNYLCVVPLEHAFPISITRFYILRKDADSPNWTEDHLIWTLGGLRGD